MRILIKTNNLIEYLSWGIALFSMLMSLFFSEVLKLIPCSLCWYQRIFMYPLVFMIPVGILKNDKNIHMYTLVLSFIGLMISSYHTLIYHGIIQEALKLCNSELSCKTRQYELFGLVSIPMMSLFSFLIIFSLNLYGEKDATQN